ncbi:MAG TPA: ABC transporter C-terminal domain-containing protein, partial [Rubrivivax sp.]|nr:ABC transporter C-terminal domain-containing protein [Rubrivivax sp.]
ATTPQADSGAADAAARPPPARTRLSFREQRELDGLPARIEAMEAEQKAIAERLASASLYIDEPQRVPELQARLEGLEAELLSALDRWEALASR